MEDLHGILKPELVRGDDFYYRAGPQAGTNLWDLLAQENAIEAATSALDEAGERHKTKRTIDVLSACLSPGSVVDMGCGYGRVAKYLLPNKTYDAYIGIDGSKKMLSLFRHRYLGTSVEQTTPLVLINSGVDDLPLEDQSVDGAFSCAVLLHNPKSVTRSAIREAHRILKPGGKFILIDSFPNRFSLNGAIGTFYQGVYFLKRENQRNGPVRYFRHGEIGDLFADFSSFEIARHGFALLPKGLPLLPHTWEAKYRTTLYDPSRALAERAVPRQLQKLCCEYIDVVAVK